VGSAKFTLTNFDVADSGSGALYEINGQTQTPPFYIEWVRNADGTVDIFYNGDLMGRLRNAGRQSNGGSAHLWNPGQSEGSWTRN
jgi:hypothetical protein